MRPMALAILALMMAPALGMAQDSNDTWNDIKAMAGGRKVKVTVGRDTLIAGTFLKASDNTLVVRRGTTEVTLDRAAVRRIKAISPARRRLNMILYGSIGMVGGLVPGAMLDALYNNETGQSVGAAPLLGALGAGIGILVTRNSGYATAYSASRSSVPPLSSVAAFDQLDRRIGPGDKVDVTSSDGAKIAGTVERLSASSLAMRAGGKRYELRPDEVKSISQRMPDSLTNGALWGLLAGAGSGAGVTVAGAKQRGHSPQSGAFAVNSAVFGGIGAGVGAVIDALHKGKKAVYVRPSEPKTASRLRSFNIAPVVSRSQKSAALSLSF